MPKQSDKEGITREKMVGHIDKWIAMHKRDAWEQDADITFWAEKEIAMLEAIRKHLTESDLAHWMDRCHELEAELAKKPTVGREETRQLERDIREAIKEEAYTSTPLNHVLLAIDHWHKKRGIEVSDSEDKEE